MMNFDEYQIPPEIQALNLETVPDADRGYSCPEFQATGKDGHVVHLTVAHPDASKRGVDEDARFMTWVCAHGDLVNVVHNEDGSYLGVCTEDVHAAIQSMKNLVAGPIPAGAYWR